MELAYKPDFEETRKRWQAYWAGEVIDRPVACIRALKDPSNPTVWPAGLNELGDPDALMRAHDAWVSSIHWLGESIPYVMLNYGPDQFAAWVGGQLEWNDYTSWSVPVIHDWNTDAGDIGAPHGEWWMRALDLTAQASEYAEGKFLIGVPDLHSNMDTLSALRSPQDLCIDLLDVPEEIDKAMKTVRRAYIPVFEGLEHAGRWGEKGYIGWMPFYSESRFAAIQCDFICMISPEHFRRWVMPALEEESSYLDHCCYHLDGPDALVHLDDILSIKGIDAIQWIPGEGNPPQVEWLDLLKKIQNAGKGLHILASPEEVKVFHKALRPEGVIYDIQASSKQEAEDLLKWLKKNT